jgi:hypothetical protein
MSNLVDRGFWGNLGQVNSLVIPDGSSVDIGDTVVFVDDPHRLQSKIFNPGTTTTLGLNLSSIQVLRN